MSDTLRVGINGFGRMGRLALRAGWDRDDIAFVHVNEIAGGPVTGAHLLEFDSVHGRWSRAIHADDSALRIDDVRIAWSDAPTPGAVDWGAAGVDVVLECSGRFRTGPMLAPYLEQGVPQRRGRGAGQGRNRAQHRPRRQRRPVRPEP